MSEKLKTIVVRRREDNQVAKIVRVPKDRFEDAMRDVRSSFSYPDFLIDTISEYENARAVLGEALGCRVARDLGQHEWMDEDTFGTASYDKQGPLSRGRGFKVPSRDMSDEHVMECLTRFGPGITVIAGELNHRVYTERFLSTLFRQLEIFAEISEPKQLTFETEIVCGPAVLIRDNYGSDRSQGSILPRLADHPNVALYCSRYRQAEHFRLAKDGVYYESVHNPDAPERQAYVSLYDPAKLDEFRIKKERILAGGGVWRSKDVRRDFLFVTEQEMNSLCIALSDDGKRFEDVDREEIQGYLLRLGVTF